MTRIDAAAAMNALLKSRPDAGGRANSTATVPVGAKVPDDRTAHAKVVSQANPLIELQVLQRIRTIAPDDPQRRRKAFRIFMESVLLNQLGRSLWGDPEFNQLVDKVVQQIEDDPSLHESSLMAAEILIEHSCAME
ncbi:hypothetical protein [Acidovorax sp. sic0104]|uniref:hypothetical protein n=1 Tax=Acidovorax sp. sic0104 TaxID=2854784 RepID=UPI001C46D172|nr:hypothetical protein [Acidovorax sp. sic0104]MBV7540579.1 hypothetical protein [Acidovorax sp. sic0104]